MATTKTPIGTLKARKTVHCSLCTESYLRKSSVLIYDRNEIESAKKELTIKLNADYTCKVCKTILKKVA